MSSSRWLSRQANDPYVRRAREHGYRARAAFKLIELDDKDRFLRPGLRVADLGAAPGSWSQVAAERVGESGRVVALDVLDIEPIPGVEVLRGDFRETDVLEQLERTVGDRVDLVLSDMAPNISGIAAADQARSMDLAELALEFARDRLEPDGFFVVKLFQGSGFDEFVADARTTFARVKLRKPAASRAESREIYLVADSRRDM
jgi:23S rRNA (uridine2552-2'-O)-methyltransferase